MMPMADAPGQPVPRRRARAVLTAAHWQAGQQVRVQEISPAGGDSLPSCTDRSFTPRDGRCDCPMAAAARCVIVVVTDRTMPKDLDIDLELLEKAHASGGEKSKKAAGNRVSQEFIVHRRQKRVLDLFGKLDWNDAYDYKRERTRR